VVRYAWSRHRHRRRRRHRRIHRRRRGAASDRGRQLTTATALGALGGIALGAMRII
jgi:hypothetical protein